MAKIVFFSIPAYGHTNPTIPVVGELTRRGHEVWYYSFDLFRARIEGAGAKFISCDPYLPPLTPGIEKKIGKDFAALIEMVTDTTVNLDAKVCAELREFQPDAIVSDSVCFWGKLFAQKLQIPYICSTTTFAFNRYTARLLRKGAGEITRTLMGIPRVNRKIKMLREHGYEVKNLFSLLQNDNNTDTIVYTTREFQPMADTFSDRYAFVGPSLAVERTEKVRNIVYISLGTVMNKRSEFYRNCVEAFRDSGREVLLTVGEQTDVFALGEIPQNITVKNHVDQLAALQRTAVFLTHCGMNSANESIYFGVPAVLYPQQSEEAMVARRMEELGVGLMLKNSTPQAIQAAVEQVLQDDTYRKNTEKLSRSFREAGGASAAAEKILKVADAHRRSQ